MRKTIGIVLSAVFLAAAVQSLCFAAPVKEPAWKKLDAKTLAALAAKGDLISVEKIGGGIELSTIGMIVNATPDKTYAAVTDLEDYPKMIPSCTKTTVSEKKGNTAVVEFNVRVIKVGPVDITTDYTLKYTFNKPKRVDIAWVKGSVKDVQGYWEIIPVPGGKKTILIYAITSNLKEASPMAKTALQQQPSTETAINLSSAIVLARAIKKSAESR